MDRFRNAELIDAIVGEWVGSHTAKEALNILDSARIPCSIVKTIDEAMDDLQVNAREMIRSLDFPGIGHIPIPGLPIKLSRTPGSVDSPAPRLGKHNEDVYCGLLGFSKEDVKRLREESVI
jgi:crotonobetainyl-CoA:carnitine CoA-transferase CaiB-like acyl-CoA transferase